MLICFRGNDNFYRQPVFLCKFKIPLVMCGHTHYGAGPIFHDYEIGNVYRYGIVIKRVYSILTSWYPYFFIFLSILGFYGFQFVLVMHKLFCQGMTQGKTHECNPEQCVRSRCENRKLFIRPCNREVNFHSLTPADPVFLHGHDPLRPPVQLIAFPEQFLCILCDTEKPLFQFLLFHNTVTSPALFVNNLLISQHSRT